MIRKHYVIDENVTDSNCNPVESDFTSLNSNNYETSLIQLDFVKSALTINPCMVSKKNVNFVKF